MREIDKIAEGLFEKVRDRYDDVSLGDENAKATSDPEKARFFNFDYLVDGHNHGNITISIIDETSLKVYFSKNISKDLDPEHKKEWYSFLRELREFAKRNLLSFEPRDITRSTLKHRDIQQQSKADSTYNKDEVVSESKLYGTKKSSYEKFGPVRIIVRHSKPVVDEVSGARSRNINAVYVETADGERFKMAENNLKYARAMARHISAGGTPHDELGQHITEMAQECSKLKPFLNNVRRRTFEDAETNNMVEAAFEYHGLLNNTLKRMSGRKGYSNCKEQFEATSTSYIPEEDMDVAAIKERFVKRVYNDKMEGALPLVYKAYDMKKNNKFAQQFESWANNVAEGWDDSDDAQQWGEEPINVDDLADAFGEEIPLGVDGMNAINAISGIINSNELEAVLTQAAAQNPQADARDVVCDWLEENIPAVYQELMNEIGDVEPADQYSEGDTYGSADGGMDGQVSEDEEESDSTEAIANAIIRRVLRGCSTGDNRMLALLRKLGPEGVTNAAVDIAEFAGPVHEIGSSDVSGWIAQMERDAGLELTETPLRKTATPSKKEKDAKYYDWLAQNADSDSTMYRRAFHEAMEEEYCDACDSAECHCDDLNEGKVKDIDIDLKELSDEEFKAKHGKTKEEMKAALAEGMEDHVNKDEKLKRMGAKPLSTLDKLKIMPSQAKAMAKGDSEDDLVHYNKSKETNEDTQYNEDIAQMRRIAGLQ